MSDVDRFVTPVATANREVYRKRAEDVEMLFKQHGATGAVECWGDDVPEGKVTSFLMVLKCESSETVVFSRSTCLRRAVRDDGWKKLLTDLRMQPDANPMPFDGKRLSCGGFRVLLQV